MMATMAYAWLSYATVIAIGSSNMKSKSIMIATSVWVAIRVEDGSRGTAEYRGRMDAATFEKITAGELTSGWLRLDDVIWEKERLDVRQDDYGSAWGYGETSFYRIEGLSRIILLADDFVRKHHKAAKSGKKLA